MPKRACDGCSIRKIKCEGIQPCRACNKAGLTCTFLKALRKGGPRKPHLKTIQQIQKTQIEYSQSSDLQSPTKGWFTDDSSVSTGSATTSPYHGGFTSGPSSPTRLEEWRGARDERKFSSSVLSTYLEIYHHRLYPVWPIVNAFDLQADLLDPSASIETYTLAVSVACATMAQLQLTPWTTDSQLEISSDSLAHELLHLRRTYPSTLIDNPSPSTIITSLFLHVHFENKSNLIKSTLYLREAVTFIQLLTLDRESTYTSSPEDELKRRLFWLLFVTERGHHMVHNVPCVLRNTIELPTPSEPVLAGFTALTRLFASFSVPVINAYVTGSQPSPSNEAIPEETLASMQEALSDVHTDSENVNEVQKADIMVTKHWMKTLVWQVSMGHGYLKSKAGKGEGMTLAYPARIAEELLGVLAGLSMGSIESHGPGIEFKLFEVTNALSDVLLCVPSSRTNKDTMFGPRDYLRGLFDVLNNIRGGNQNLLGIIKGKASQFLINEPSCDRVLEVDIEPTSLAVNDKDEENQQESSIPDITTDLYTYPYEEHPEHSSPSDSDMDFYYTLSLDPSTTNNYSNPPSSLPSAKDTTSPRVSERTISDHIDITSAPWFDINVGANGEIIPTGENLMGEVDAKGVFREADIDVSGSESSNGVRNMRGEAVRSWMEEVES